MFDSDLWTTEAPKGEMFIWTYWCSYRQRWQTGLGYWTVTKGQWADAYGDSDGKRKATHFHPMPKPPESPGR
jgi:hypothetical protein